MSKLKPEDLRSLKIFHTAMSFAPIFIMGIFLYMLQSDGDLKYSTGSVYFFIASFAVMLGILIGLKVYTTNINNASSRKFDSYDDAHLNFRTTNVLRWAIIEGNTLMSLTLGFIDKNMMVFIPAALGIVAILVSKLKEEHFDNYKWV